MRNQYLLSVFIASLVISATPAMAGPSVDETRAMQADGHISLSMVDGDLDVRGWDNDSFELTGELGTDKHKVTVTGDEDDWDIEIRHEGSWGWNWKGSSSGNTRLTLKVPHAARVDLESVSADIDVAGLDGAHLGIETVSGDMDLDVAVAHIELESVSGDAEVRGNNSRLELETVSGDIRASGIQQHADIESVSGDLRLQAVDLENLQAGTVSGDVIIDTSLANRARVRLETHSGEIELNLPADTRFDLDSDTFSGDVDNEFGSDSNSDISIDAETFSGNITISKK